LTRSTLALVMLIRADSVAVCARCLLAGFSDLHSICVEPTHYATSGKTYCLGRQLITTSSNSNFQHEKKPCSSRGGHTTSHHPLAFPSPCMEKGLGSMWMAFKPPLHFQSLSLATAPSYNRPICSRTLECFCCVGHVPGILYMGSFVLQDLVLNCG